jgi:hypothetical protein
MAERVTGKKLGDTFYLGVVYERDMPADDLMRIYRVQMFELGHSYKEIEGMTLEQIGDVLGYWSEKDRAEKAIKKEKENLDG